MKLTGKFRWQGKRRRAASNIDGAATAVQPIAGRLHHLKSGGGGDGDGRGWPRVKRARQPSRERARASAAVAAEAAATATATVTAKETATAATEVESSPAPAAVAKAATGSSSEDAATAPRGLNNDIVVVMNNDNGSMDHISRRMSSYVNLRKIPT